MTTPLTDEEIEAFGIRIAIDGASGITADYLHRLLNTIDARFTLEQVRAVAEKCVGVAPETVSTIDDVDWTINHIIDSVRKGGA